MVVFEIIAELCCSFLFYPAVEAARKDLKENQETKFVSINNNCSIDGCNAMRHEAFPPKESKEEIHQEENWWGDEN